MSSIQITVFLTTAASSKSQIISGNNIQAYEHALRTTYEHTRTYELYQRALYVGLFICLMHAMCYAAIRCRLLLCVIHALYTVYTAHQDICSQISIYTNTYMSIHVFLEIYMKYNFHFHKHAITRYDNEFPWYFSHFYCLLVRYSRLLDNHRLLAIILKSVAILYNSKIQELTYGFQLK